MTACELIQEIKTSGGSVELAAGGRIRVTHAPRHLALELKRMKPEIVSHLRLEAVENQFSDAQLVGYGFDTFRAALRTDPVLQRLVGRFSLKPVSPERLREKEDGRQSRPGSALILEPAKQPQRKPTKQPWIDGPRCLGCRGTWHSEETLGAHMLVCPLVQRTRR